MRLTILGAGPVGLGSAALAAGRGHAVTLWSPRGGGTRGIAAAVLAEGALRGRFPLRVAADLGRALADADAVLLAVPGAAQASVMHRVAGVVQGAPAVLVAPATALAPLLLERLLVARGIRVPVGALAQPPVIARRLGADRVWVDAVLPRLALAAVPAAAVARLGPVAAALFGLGVDPLADALVAALADAMPLLHAAQALSPAAPARLAAALLAERDALAAAFGHRLPEPGPLPPPEAARAPAEAPHALSFLLALGQAARVRLPVAEAVLTLLEVQTGQKLRGNAILAELDPRSLARQLAEGSR